MAIIDDITFRGGATSSIFEEYDERKKYQNYSGFQSFRTIDTLFERINYGIFNENFEPIFPVVETPDANLENFPEYASSVYVLPFVAKAFKDMRKDYLNYIENGGNLAELAQRIGFVSAEQKLGALSYPKYINNIVPQNGFINFEEQYQNYFNFHLRRFAVAIDRPNFGEKNTTTFRGVAEAFIKVMQTGFGQRINAIMFPITRSGFSTSSKRSIMTTGLCIELVNLNKSLDEAKGEMITTTDFRCFASFANAYGFFIDKNVPWRLIADLDSPKMREYMVQSINLPNSQSSLDYYNTLVEKTHLDDWQYLRNFISKLYKFFNGTDAFANIVAGGEGGIYNDPHFNMELLYVTRMLELGVSQNTADFSNHLRIVLELLDLPGYGIRQATEYIGTVSAQKLKETYGSN